MTALLLVIATILILRRLDRPRRLAKQRAYAKAWQERREAEEAKRQAVRQSTNRTPRDMERRYVKRYAESPYAD